MDFHAIAATTYRQRFGMLKQLLADAFAALSFCNAEIADASEITGQGQLRNKMQGKETQHLTAMFSHQQRFTGIAAQLCQTLFNKAFGAAVA